jgi:hypothetical protein
MVFSSQSSNAFNDHSDRLFFPAIFGIIRRRIPIFEAPFIIWTLISRVEKDKAYSRSR